MAQTPDSVVRKFSDLRFDRRVVLSGVVTPLLPIFSQTAEANSSVYATLISENEDASRYRQKYTLSCEVAAIKIVLFHYGLNPTEDELLVRLGSSEDPNLGFRGNVNGGRRLTDYGAHAPAIKRLVESLPHSTVSFRAEYLFSILEIINMLDRNMLVLAWFPVGLQSSYRQAVRLSDGGMTVVIPGEHVGVIRGYDSIGFYLYDPLPARPQLTYAPFDRFERAMSLFDHPALAVLPGSRDIPGGRYYALAGEKAGMGFAIQDGSFGNFWSVYQEYGGSEILGPPISHPSPMIIDGTPYIMQVCERSVLEKQLGEQEPQVLSPLILLSQLGYDEQLYFREWTPFVATDLPDDDRWPERLSWIAEPAFRAQFSHHPETGNILSLFQSIQVYGLPLSQAERVGPTMSQRFENGVFRIYLEPVPGVPRIGFFEFKPGGTLVKTLSALPYPSFRPQLYHWLG